MRSSSQREQITGRESCPFRAVTLDSLAFVFANLKHMIATTPMLPLPLLTRILMCSLEIGRQRALLLTHHVLRLDLLVLHPGEDGLDEEVGEPRVAAEQLCEEARDSKAVRGAPQRARLTRKLQRGWR